MTLNLEGIGVEGPTTQVTWGSKDALIYALGVGAGHSPFDELQFTTENSADVVQKTLPTMPVVLADAGGLDLGDFSMTQVLHAEQSVTNYQEIPVAGKLNRASHIVDIADKGKDALIYTTTRFTDPESNDLVSEIATTIFVRGEGGFGGSRGSAEPWELPEREPDRIVDFTTRPEQALLYRLSGDRNPLHSDPTFARSAGLDQPILHGLCTYGFAGRALLQLVDGDTSRFGHISARFASPVVPGATLQVRTWKISDQGHHFEVHSAGKAVLSRGVFTEVTK